MTEPLFLAVHEWEDTAGLPPAWRRGCEAWAFAKRLVLGNELSVARLAEPVEVEAEFHLHQVGDPAREVRVLAVEPGGRRAAEIPSQVHCLGAEADRLRCRVYFLADLPPAAQGTWLILYGNRAAAAPGYHTDLQIRGEGYALDVDNAFYGVRLAPTNGHLKSVVFHQGEAAFSGYGPPMDPGVIGDGKHGVEGSVHWNPDWSDGRTGRYRVTNWPRPPHVSVLRGPVCARVERWGHPILGLGPGGNHRKVLARVAYTFWAATPYFLVDTSLEILEDVRFRDCRNDEWVGMGASMPQQAWMSPAGQFGRGRASWRGEDPRWLTFYNEDNGDAFATLHLDYECTHPHFPAPASVAILDRAWVRYPVRNAILRAGDVIRERNALLVHRYEPGREHGFGLLADCEARLRSPLVQDDAAPVPRPLTRANVADALRACRDLEIYVDGNYDSRRTPGFYDLGFVRRIEIDADRVRVDMIVPYEGRRTWFGWFADTAQEQIRRRVAGVGQVEVRLLDEPVWGPGMMTDGARRITGW